MAASSKRLRLATALVTLLASAVAAGSAFAARIHHAARSSSVRVSALESNVLADINAFRIRHHLAPLRINLELTRAADQHSEEMARLGYFSHSSADGAAFWRRIQGYYGSADWSLWSVGENLLWSSPSVSARRALQMWIASPEHLRNLLTARWREIGVSAVHVSSAPGTFHGLGVTIVTTDFGVRR